jgi:hypothetical protein
MYDVYENGGDRNYNYYSHDTSSLGSSLLELLPFLDAFSNSGSHKSLLLPQCPYIFKHPSKPWCATNIVCTRCKRRYSCFSPAQEDIANLS